MAPRPTRPVLRAVLNALATFLATLKGVHQMLFDAVRWSRMRYVWLKPQPTDIFIATAPKAGTTWTQQIVFQLLTRGRGEFQHIDQVAPFVDVMSLIPHAERLLDAMPAPRVFKTHLTYGVLRPPAACRIIYVTRVASDSLLSRYQHDCLMQGQRIDFDRYVQHSLRANEWGRHLASWWPHRADPNVLHVRYADLVADREACLRRIGAFLGVPVQDEDLPLLMEKTGFEYMKQHDARFDPRLSRHEPLDPGQGFVFKGGVGRGKQTLKPEQQARLDARDKALRQKLLISDEAL
ncbi:sulfotransferase domain-containing protein [Corallococcus praedator]|uniref:Sulfotransferase domain-containing protein n=1 Tax=Corallococcus praedator TaxID=2316724 RepID=A0ABX9QII3_9BACT|nr:MULTISPECIES: sulfotransferase domain-containing protein [Corallococcus]RKH28816.1 sulfotransferase domain-containing protein [Corallococcus sp. CA031C]RKI08336.1 sulfotransferase domain-containing protein [Corallococcus praedator]